MATRDFFISFGSNAPAFVKQVKEDLAPLEEHVKSLRSQLAALGADAARVGAGAPAPQARSESGKSGNPTPSVANGNWDAFFRNLDSAGSQLAEITQSLETAAKANAAIQQQQKQLLINLNNALRGRNQNVKDSDPAQADYEAKLDKRVKSQRNIYRQNYPGITDDEVRERIRRKDELKGELPEGVRGSGTATVRLVDVPQVAIDEAAFNRVVDAVERNVKATQAVERAVNRAARGRGGSGDGDEPRKSSRKRDRYSTREVEIGLTSADPQTRANSARAQLKRRERLDSLYQLKDTLAAGQDPTPELLKTALDRSKKLKEALLQGGEKAIKGIDKAIKGVERDFKRSGVPETAELKAIYDQAVKETGRPSGRAPYEGTYKRKKGKRREEPRSDSRFFTDSELDQLRAETAQAQARGDDKRVATLQARIAKLEAIVAALPRAEKRSINRERAQRAREVDRDTTLSAQERVDRAALLDAPLNPDEFRRRSRSRKAGDRLDFADIKRIATAYREEGYRVPEARTKKDLVENLIKAGAEYAQNGPQTYDLSTSGKKIATKIDKNLQKMVKEIIEALVQTAGETDAALQILRQNALSGGGRGPRLVEPNALKGQRSTDGTPLSPAKRSSKGRQEYGAIYGGDPEREAMVDRARATLAASSTRVTEAALRQGLALYAKQPDLNIFDSAFDAQIQGTGEEAKRARRALARLRAIFTVLDQMSGVRFPGLEGKGDLIAKGIAARDKSRDEREALGSERSQRALSRQNLREAAIQQLFGSATQLGGRGFTKLLPGLRLGEKGRVFSDREDVGEDQIKPINKALARYVKALQRRAALAEQQGVSAEETLRAEQEVKRASTKIFDAYDKAMGGQLQTRNSVMDVQYTDKKGRQRTRQERVREYDLTQQAEAERIAQEQVKRELNRERVRRQRLRNTGANLMDAASLGVSDVRVDNKTVEADRAEFDRLRKRALKDLQSGKPLDKSTALGRMSEILAKPVEKVTATDLEKDGKAAKIQTAREIEAARQLLARAGVRWSAELNKSLNEATSVGDLFKKLKQLLQEGTLQLSAYNPRSPEARPGRRGRTTRTLDGETIYGTPADEPVRPFTPKPPKVLGTYDEVKARLGGKFGADDSNLLKAQQILTGGVTASAREIGRLSSVLAKANLGVTDYQKFKSETGLKGKDLLAEIVKRMGAGGGAGAGAGGDGVGGGAGGKKGRAGGGGGDNRDILERILAAINKIYERLGSGVKVSGAARASSTTDDARLNAPSTRPRSEPKIYTTKEGRQDLLNKLPEKLRELVQNANTTAQRVNAAAEMVGRKWATQAGAVAYFRDELKMTAKEAAKFEAAVRAKVGDGRLADGAKRGSEKDAANQKGQERKARVEGARARESARAEVELAEAMSRVSSAAQRELAALQGLVRAGASDKQIVEQQTKAYRAMNAELEKLGMKAPQRQALMRTALTGAMGQKVSVDEVKSIGRSANLSSDPATQAGGSLGGATGSAFAMQARSAVETQFFGNHGFWSRMVNSTGTFIVRNFSAGLVFGITNAFQDAIAQGIDTQSTFVRISSALEDTGRSTDGVKTELAELSQRYGVALKDVYTTAAGLTGLFDSTDVGNEKLLELTKIATQLQLISGGALNATEAMRSLASVTSAYGEIDSNVAGVTQQEIADVLTVVQTQLGVNIEESIEGVARLSGQAKELGIEFANAATYVGAISKFTGQTGAAAGEQFSRILASLQTGRTQKVVEDSFGPEIGKGIAESLRARDFTTAIDGILANYSKLNDAEKNRVATAIGGARQAAAVNGLLIKGAQVLDVVTKAQNAKGAADERAALISAQLRAELEKARQGFVNFVTALVDAGALNALGVVLKVVVAGMNLVNKALTSWNEIGDKIPLIGLIQNLGLAVLGFVAIAKVATVAWTNFQASVAASQATFAKMTGVTTSAATAAAATSAAQSRAALSQRVSSLDAPVRGRRAFLVPDVEARMLGYNNAMREGTVRERTERLRTDGTRYQRTLARGAMGLDNLAQSARASAARQRALAQEALASGNATRASLLHARALQGQALAQAAAGTAAGAAGRGLAAMAVQTGSAMAGQIAIMALLAAMVQGFSQLGDAKKRWEEFYNSIFGKDPKKEEGFVADRTGFAKKDREALGEQGGLTGFLKGFSNTAAILAQRAFQDTGAVLSGRKSFTQSATETLGQVGGVVPQLKAGGSVEKAIGAAQSIIEKKIDTIEEGSARADEINEIFNTELSKLNDDKSLTDQQRNIGAEFIEQQRAAALAVINRQTLVAAGLREVDALTAEQLSGVSSIINQIGSLSDSTLDGVENLINAQLEALGLDNESTVKQKIDEMRGYTYRAPTPQESREYTKFGEKAPEQVRVDLEDLSLRERQGKGVEALREAVRIANVQLANSSNKTKEERDADREAVAQATQALDQAWRTHLQGLLQDAQDKVQIALYKGDTAGFSSAIQEAANVLAQQRGDKQITDTQYQVQIQGLRQQEYQQQVATGTRELQLKRAQATDQVEIAKLDLKIAQQSLAIAQSTGVSKLGVRMDAATILSLELQEKQAQLALTQARQAAAEAAKAKAREAADKAAAAREARRELAITRIDPFREVEVARARLSAAYAKQREAASRFGRNSAEYYQAAAGVIEAQREVNAALDRVVEANSNLAIAIAEAAGKTVDAAKIKLAEAQRKAREALKRGGSGSAEYKNAQAEVVSAQAALRDAKLDDAIGTIDFQKEMGQITAQEAIRQLQNLLKMKGLTEQQRRDLKLKIKGLQDELQSQFAGQWNIGDEIKMPTPYEMRRAIGVDRAQAAVAATASTLQAELVGAYRQMQPASGGASDSAVVAQALTQVRDAIAAKGDSYITEDNRTITVDGTDVGMVLKLIKDALGPLATQRTGTATRKGV